MANSKISALTSATTPLAGTETLPIVQSSATVKVAVNDLTVRNIRANATTGILQVTGPTAGTTRVVTVPDANFTAARTDAAQSFTGDQTLSTGNIIQGTAAKGINFTANTGAAGKTSQLLNWYEEGTWTPSLGGLATYTTQTGRYTRVGRQITISGVITVNLILTGSQYEISGLPFASLINGGVYVTYFAGLALNVYFVTGYILSGGSTINLVCTTAATATITNAPALLTNGSTINFTAVYHI